MQKLCNGLAILAVCRVLICHTVNPLHPASLRLQKQKTRVVTRKHQAKLLIATSVNREKEKLQILKYYQFYLLDRQHETLSELS
jgi:hypothetical protein